MEEDEGADMDVTNSSAPGMSETEDDDQLSKKDVRPLPHHLSVTFRNPKSTASEFCTCEISVVCCVLICYDTMLLIASW